MCRQQFTALLVVVSVTLTHVLGQSGTVTKVPGCGSTVGCFSDCSGTVCSFIASWSMSANTATYTLTSNISANPEGYIAVGFSDDRIMNNDDVFGCARSTGGNIVIFTAKNGDHRPPIKYNDQEIILSNSTYDNGLLTCTFKRPVAASSSGRVDVDSAWTLFFAKGPATFDAANQAAPGYHATTKYISGQQVKVSENKDISQTDTSSVQTTPQPSSGTVTKVPGCGSTVGCFSDCSGTVCSFIASWIMSANTATYTLTSNISANPEGYIAVGFSDDRIMNNDDVFGCARNTGGNIVVFTAKNGDHSPPVKYNDQEIILSNSTYDNSLLTCTFKRPVAASSSGRVDLDNAWTLFFAKGPATFDAANQAAPGYHATTKYISGQQVKVSENKDISQTDTSSVQTTPQPSSGTVTKVPGCGSTVGCFSDCSGTVCSFIASWIMSANTATYTLTSNISANPEGYIAVGFSDDKIMNNDDVYGCARSTGGNIVVFTAKNGDHSPPVKYNDQEIILSNSTYDNGLLTCTFKRPVAASSSGRVDLDSAWTLFFAKGPATFDAANQASPGYHATTKYISGQQVKVSENKDISQTNDSSVQEPPVGSVSKVAGCGTEIGCFYNCEGSMCRFIVSWKENGANADYTLTANVDPNPGAWIAVGFSDDSIMNNDDVLGCATNSSGGVSLITGRNGLHSAPTMYHDAEIKLTSSRYDSGLLTCSFQRPVTASTSGRVNVGSAWTLLFASGPATFDAANQVTISFHGNNKYISDKQVTIKDKLDLSATKLEYPLVKAHGSLMIVAWIFLASIGIVLARYFKPVWKGLICSEKVWFQMHRMCMILVFCLTAIGFIIIFADVGGYSHIQDDSRQFLVGHPIIGIIVMILTVLNPVMALFRCHPGTPKRPIFNWAHLFVGTSAHILGVVNIFFGVLLTKSDVPYELVYILGAYVAWQIFVELLLTAISCFGKVADRSEAYELSSGENHKKVVSEESSGAILSKRIILVVHCIIVAAFAAVLIGLLATGKDKLQ